MGVCELTKEIRCWMEQGGTLAEVKREIIDCSPLEETQRYALWLYAATRPESLRAAESLSPLRRPELR